MPQNRHVETQNAQILEIVVKSFVVLLIEELCITGFPSKPELSVSKTPTIYTLSPIKLPRTKDITGEIVYNCLGERNGKK